MPQESDAKTFMIEDAEIIFRNFEGKEGMYNVKGDRNFSVILPPDLAAKMDKDGWSVKVLKAREETDEDRYIIEVKVSFKNRPPRVVMMTSRARTNLGEDSVEVLDWANIAQADLICRGYDWDVNGKTGTKAYLQSLFVTIQEDYLEKKYAVNEVGE